MIIVKPLNLLFSICSDAEEGEEEEEADGDAGMPGDQEPGGGGEEDEGQGEEEKDENKADKEEQKDEMAQYGLDHYDDEDTGEEGL